MADGAFMTQLPRHNIALLILMAILASVFFFSFGTNDARIWIIWMENISQYGFVDGYRYNNHDYPPLMSVVMWYFVNAATTLGLPALIGLKTLLLLALAITTVMIYRMFANDILSVFLFYLYLMFGSMSLAYVDICLAPLLLLFYHSIRQQHITRAVLAFTFACLLKFSPLIIAPFVFVYLVANIALTNQVNGSYGEAGLRRFAREAVLPVILVLAALFVVFGFAPIQSFMLGAGTIHPFLSGYALNFNWIVTRIIQLFFEERDFFTAWQDSAVLNAAPPAWAILQAKILFVGFYLATLIAFIRVEKTLENFLLYTVLGYLSYFMFNTGVHENHLFIACLFAIVLCHVNREYLVFALVLCFMSAINMFLFYGYDGQPMSIWPEWHIRDCIPSPDTICAPPVDFRLLLAIFNTVYFLYFWFHIIFKNSLFKRGSSHV